MFIFRAEPEEGFLAVTDMEMDDVLEAGAVEAFKDEVFELVVELEGVEAAVGWEMGGETYG